MEQDLVTMATQFGMAGLIAWMWLTERKGTSSREKQLTETHERLMEQRVQLDALLQVIGDHTRAVSALEAGQKAMHALLERFVSRESPVDA